MSTRAAAPMLGTHPLGPKGPLWWGMIMLILIELTVFGGLMAIYYYLKLYNPEFPPPGIDKPELLLPTLNTFVLLGAGLAMYLADKGIKEDDQLRLKLWKSVSLVLAIVFLALKYVEYSGYDYDWTTHAYGSIVWTITGFHAAHVISVALKTVVVLAMAFRGMFRSDRRMAVEANSLYFYFVVLIWLPLYFTLYISPRL